MKRFFWTGKKVFIYFLFALLLVSGGLSTVSCSKKTMPTEQRIGFDGRDRRTSREQRRRGRVARKEKRQTRRLEGKVNRKTEKSKREGRKVQDKMIKRHVSIQHSDVQQRMKESKKEADRYNRREKKPFWKRIQFWRKK